MSTTPHNPGPWTADLDDEKVYDADGAPVASTHWFKSHVTPEQMDASARLIAAAPDLLEACERALPDYWQEIMDEPKKHDGLVACEMTYGDVRRIAAAIAKATQP